MMPSRGMGAMLPSKMPKGVRKARRDDTDFTQFEEGGTVSDKEKEKEDVDAVKFGVLNPRLNLAKGMKELGGRLTAEKQLGPNTSLQAYLDAKIGNRGVGVPSGGVQLTHRFSKGGLAKQAATAIAMKEAGVKPKKMAEGGKTKSKVNEAGNYTKPELRKRIFNAVKAEATAGTGAGQWSARKAQMVAQRYKKAGGGYRD
jgi:hypothetical protein